MIQNKILTYFNKNTGEIYSLEYIKESMELNIPESIKLFKKHNNLNNIDIDMKYFDKKDFDDLFQEHANNFFYIDIKNNEKLKVSYHKKQKDTHTYLWNLMSPQRDYTQEQVEKMYNEDYINTNLKNVFNLSSYFHPIFLSLDQLELRDFILPKNWNTHFIDPFLKESAYDKLILAKDIIKNGTYFPIIVTESHEKNKYIVQEGSHRISSLKLAQLENLIPSNFKILCIISPIDFYNLNSKEILDKPISPITGRYNIDPVWGTNTLNNKNYLDLIHKEIEKENGIFINDYTVETTVNILSEAYNLTYIYPLFLRDLFFKYRNIKPSPIINNEKLFYKWLNA